MDSGEHEAQPKPAYDDPEPRLTKLEEAVAALQCDHALLRQEMNSGFETAQVQLALTEEKLRREFHDGLHHLERGLTAKIDETAQRLEGRIVSEVQTLVARLDHQDARMERQDGRMERQDSRMDRLDAKLDKLDSKIDQLAKWMIATQLSTLALIVGIAIRLFLR